ncbi:gp436 family protein [Pseudoalteromonas rhizosphaerae]|uniref:gp436 family protein n=1 Tax=Pseudoalteromonas rhizosphaerae TaxID=2518973 RepID=UPI0038512FCD
MAYATITAMQQRFGERDLIYLSERDDAPADVINTAVVEQAINDASDVINGYLAGRYELPLVTVPNLLEQFCCDIARYKLGTNDVPEHVETRYKDAIKFLMSVAKGELSIGVDALGQDAKVQDTATIQSAGSVFAREKTKGFI